MNSRMSVLPFLPSAIYPGEIVTVLVVLGASLEYARMLGIQYPRNGFWLGIVWLSLVIALNFINPSRPGTNDSLPAGLGIYILLVIVALEAFIWGRNTRRRWNRASIFFSGNVFLYISCVSILHLFHAPFSQFFKTVPDIGIIPMGGIGVFVVLGAVFFCDSMAFVFGRIFGKHHFTSISPNKTIEGSIAGLIAAFIITTTGWIFFRAPGMPLFIGPILGILIGLFAQTGDLLMSLIKRYFRVKDASDIIPGHGGLLDRFDSIFFTAPVLWLFFWIVGKFITAG